MQFIKKGTIFLIVLSFFMQVTQEIKAAFDDRITNSYFFNGHFAVHSPFKDLYYKISTMPEIELPTNKLILLSDIIAHNSSKVKVDNGTKIILRPEISATDYSNVQKQTVLGSNPFVIIERKNDIITIYLMSQSIGNKLVFNIPAFENLIKKSWMYQHGLTRESTWGWNFGFEFFTTTSDFEGGRSFFSNMGINILDLELAWKTGDLSPVQWFLARVADKSNMRKWHTNVLFDSGVAYKKALSDEDVAYVYKLLTEAGVKFR